MSDNKPNDDALDLISRVQRARMQFDADAKPSEISAVYWIEAKPLDNPPAPTSRAGHWLLETTLDDVDEVWATIKAATEAGDLGYKSKVSTSARAGNVNARVIHVCTVDADDAADKSRVREALRDLGFAGDIVYKSNAD